MKLPDFVKRSERIWSATPPAITTAVVFVSFLLARSPATASGTVTNCTEAELRAAISGGGLVTFACDGVITLSNTIVFTNTVTFDATSHQVTVSGGNSVRVFEVVSNVSVTVINLTIRDGRSQNGTNGLAGTDGGHGDPGGGLFNAGTLTLLDCAVVTNRTGNGGYGTTLDMYGPYTAGGNGGAGGGIFNAGTLILSNCVVAGNATGFGGAAGGGLTYHPPGGNGGSGGGIYNTGTLYLVNSIVRDNRTGNGLDNSLRGPGSNGGNGGGIWSGGYMTANSCTFNGNTTGSGGHGGVNQTVGGQGGAGGSGGAIFGMGSSMLTNCTISGNWTGYGGIGGSGSPPFGQKGADGPVGTGAGVCNQSDLSVVNCTVSTNRIGGGIVNLVGVASLLNTIVALNGGNPPDVSGKFQSLGHNLIGVTNGGSGFVMPGDLVGSVDFPLNPKIGPLADNGGPTLTMALLPGSPAINAGDSAFAPQTDQRGVARPQSSTVDIGAYEFEFTFSSILSASSVNPTNFWLQLFGAPTQQYTLQVSTNLLNWSALTTCEPNTNGLFEFIDTNQNLFPQRFYRLENTTP